MSKLDKIFERFDIDGYRDPVWHPEDIRAFKIELKQLMLELIGECEPYYENFTDWISDNELRKKVEEL